MPAVFEGDLLPRVAVVHHPNGRKKTYWLTHLPAHTVRGFWEMRDPDKLKFLNKHFNKHHKKPRAQGGKRGNNLSNVDIVSHGMYNNLIFMVARNSRIPLTSVKTIHIQKFLSQFLPVAQRLLIDQDTGHLHGPDALERIMNHAWLPTNEPIRFYAHDNSYPKAIGIDKS
jgi:hypothetical protein